MDATVEPWHLTLELFVSLLAVLVMTVIHSAGLIAILQSPHLDGRRLDEATLTMRSTILLGGLGLLLFALHLFEITLFALFYWAIDTVHRLEAALYLSASAYATLGGPNDYFPREWRILIAVEGLIGFVLITWSAAFIINTMHRLRRT